MHISDVHILELHLGILAFVASQGSRRTRTRAEQTPFLSSAPIRSINSLARSTGTTRVPCFIGSERSRPILARGPARGRGLHRKSLILLASGSLSGALACMGFHDMVYGGALFGLCVCVYMTLGTALWLLGDPCNSAFCFLVNARCLSRLRIRWRGAGASPCY